jgi:hypothetical protein
MIYVTGKRPKMQLLEVLTLSWCVVAAAVVFSALSFAYRHPAEFRRCGGACPPVAAQPCPCLNLTLPAKLDKP